MHENTKGARIEIGDPKWSKLVGLCSVNGADLAILAKYRESIGKRQASAVADNFYGHVLQEADLRRIIESNSSVDRLSATLATYVETLFSGTYDDATVAGRRVIGEVHDRIDLPLGAYLGAYLKIHEVVISELVSRHRFGGRDLYQAVMAYLRVAQADMSIVVQSFIDARDQTQALIKEVSSMAETLAAAASVSESRETSRMSSWVRSRASMKLCTTIDMSDCATRR